jgi:hypothetical protein
MEKIRIRDPGKTSRIRNTGKNSSEIEDQKSHRGKRGKTASMLRKSLDISLRGMKLYKNIMF